MINVLVDKKNKDYRAFIDDELIVKGKYEQNVILGVLRYLRNIDLYDVVGFYRTGEAFPFYTKTLTKEAAHG